MRIRLAVSFEVRDEARFLSHHDMMRLMERAVVRAKLPVKYSQGFNPRPKVTLPVPRPVGVSSRAEWLVLELTEAVEPAVAMARLAPMAPEGVRLTSGQMAPAERTFQPAGADFELAVEPAPGEALQRRLAELQSRPQWPWTRQTPKAGGAEKPLDLKQLIRRLEFDGSRLSFTLVPQGQTWARPEEVLGLLGLDPQVDLARLTRLGITWAAPPDSQSSPSE